MPSTDADGKPLLILREGQAVTIVVDDMCYRGTLHMRMNGIQEDWYIKLLSEEGEIEIHKREEPKDEPPELPSSICGGCERHEDRIFGDGQWIHVANFGGGTSDCTNPNKK